MRSLALLLLACLLLIPAGQSSTVCYYPHSCDTAGVPACVHPLGDDLGFTVAGTGVTIDPSGNCHVTRSGA